MEIKNVAIIGSGTMGNGIAHVFAQCGYQVSLIDVSKEALNKALSTISKNLDRMVAKALIKEEEKINTLKNIITFSDMRGGVNNADLVIEAAIENMEIKINIFKELDKLCMESTILASNTSSISITKIGASTQRANKVIGMHFMNPVPVIKLVEIIRGYSTSNETNNTIVKISKSLNKIPVEVNDYPGFVANRILMPMINEAITSLHEGVAGVQEIDTIMKLGMAHPMGPLQLADFIGLDVCLSILNVLFAGFGNSKYAPCPLLINMVAAGHLGIKSNNGFYTYKPGNMELMVADRFKM